MCCQPHPTARTHPFVSCEKTISVRHRPYKVSAASWSLALRVAWTAHLTSRGVRSRPEASSRSTSRSIWSVRSLGEAPDQRLGHPSQLAVAVAIRWCPLHSEYPDELALVGGPVDGVGGQPMPVQVPAVQCCPAAVRSLGSVGHY
jgi:hypothetical protein